MSDLVPADEIERIVGVERHPTRHYARAISSEQTVYVLHSQKCKDSGGDLRECFYSLALDKGIDMNVWGDWQDRPVRVTLNRDMRLIPVVPGMRFT